MAEAVDARDTHSSGRALLMKQLCGEPDDGANIYFVELVPSVADIMPCVHGNDDAHRQNSASRRKFETKADGVSAPDTLRAHQHDIDRRKGNGR